MAAPGGVPSTGPAPGLRRTDFHAAIRRNNRNTVWLCALMALIGAGLGYVVGWAAEVYGLAVSGSGDPAAPATAWQAVTYASAWGTTGAAVMLLLSAAWILVALTAGDRIVLGMAGARLVDREREPVLHNVVEEMAIAAGVPKPRVAVMETPALNAFATGLRPEKAAVAVTRGLLDRLERSELQAVVAHEMGHVANNDVLYATAIGVIVGLIALVADGALRSLRYARLGRGRSGSRGKGAGAVALVALVVLVISFIVAPLAARLVQAAISREREYLADATAVRFTRNPLALIGALSKIDESSVRLESANRAIQHLFVVNPLKRFGDRAGALFSTHPPTPKRIERLRNLG